MESEIEATDTSLLFLADYIDNELDNVDQLTTYIKTSSSITTYVESKKQTPEKKLKAFDTLNEYCQNNASSKYLHRVVITNLYNSFIQVISPAYSSTVNLANALPEQDFFNMLTEPTYSDYNLGFITDPFNTSKKTEIVPFLEPISYSFSSELRGYVFIEIETKLFSDAFKNSYHSDTTLLLTLGNNTYLYNPSGHFTLCHNDYEIISEPTKIKNSRTGQINVIRDDAGNKYTVVTESLNREGIYVSQIMNFEHTLGSMHDLWIILLAVLITLLLLSLMINAYLNRAISIPVEKILNKLILVSEGDFSEDKTIEWNHELGDIGRGVNALADNINSLIETRISYEKEKKDLEYKVLQSQINPHFLYNTLNSIKWMAQIQGATGIVEMTTSLAILLKSISKGTKLLIPIDEEINLVKNYFTIQKYRYGGTIDLDIDIEDDKLLEYSIIKFTLQPIVENAIFHGIEPTGSSGKISIHVYEADGNIKIDITDDGVGMSEETITKVLSENTESSSDFFKEIGVSNVQKRLQYEFGDQYGISITSVLGEYTTMSICIPPVKYN